MQTLLKVVGVLLAIWLAFTVLGAVFGLVGTLVKTAFWILVIGGGVAAGITAVGWVKNKNEGSTKRQLK